MDNTTLLRLQAELESIDEIRASLAYQEIVALAKSNGIELSNSAKLLESAGEKKLCIPALNVRLLTFDFVKLILNTVHELGVMGVIFELAPTESRYTAQPYQKFAGQIVLGAIYSKYRGPLYLQVDHLQAKKLDFTNKPEQDIQRVLGIIAEAKSLGIKNIDIDGSTLTDWQKTDLEGKLMANVAFTKTILDQVSDLDLRFGVEVGHIGKVNTTPEEVEYFLNSLKNHSSRITKVAIQTGTQHGGKIDSDGKIQAMTIEFDQIVRVSKIVRKFGLSGVVQHGASTLDDNSLKRLGKSGVVEVHLATAWQNIFFEHCPIALKATIDEFTVTNFINEKEEFWTTAQLLYRMRKKSLGAFREQINSLSVSEKEPILNAWRNHFVNIVRNLKICKR